MAVAQITLDVLCQREWASSPVYRVYVDGDLLTERTWVWPAYDVFIKEHIEVDIDPGLHKIIVQTTTPTGKIIFKNVYINQNLLFDTMHNEYQEYTFSV